MRTSLIAIATVTAALAGGVTAAGSAPQASSQKPCPIGELRPLDPDYIKVGVHPVTEPFVIGCPVLHHSGRLELVAFREGPSLRKSYLCVDTNHRNGSSGSCTEPDRRLHGIRLPFPDVARPARFWYFGQFASWFVAKARL